MMKERLFILLLSFVCFRVQMQAQSSSQELPKIVPPSPNVAALQRYGDIPVSPYTGVPSISIPLYEVKAGNITVPISISYHASGIKVADEASRVGLGWAFEAGGVISRTVVGDDDFNPDYLNYHAAATKPDLVSGIRDFGLRPFIIQSDCNIAVPGMTNLKNDLDVGYNYQPDLYNFNFLKYSGKFFLKRNKDVVLAKKEKIQIKCLDAAANAWEVMTDDGNKFLFEEFETYTENDYNPALLAHKSAWYLTRIITPEGETISFQYSTSQNYIKTSGSLYESYNPNVLPTTSTNINGSPGAFPSFQTVSPGKQYKNVLLNKIVFKTGEVRFSYSIDRVDVDHDVKLTGVQVYVKTGASSFSLIKQWGFEYSYFEGTATNAYTTPSETMSKRLKLDKVTEMDKDGNGNPPYQFNYNMVNTPNPSVLPLKTSYSRDHWGYYNGKTNYSLIPAYQPGNLPGNPVLSYLGIQGNSRDPDPNYAQLFSLKEIIYPTGGKTVLEYESNDYDFDKSIVNDRSDLSSIPEPVEKVAEKEYTDPTGTVPTSSTLSSYLMDLTDLYLLPSQTVSKVQLTGFFRFQSNILPSGCNISQNLVKLLLMKRNESSTDDIMGESYLTDYLGNSSKPMSVCEGPPAQPIGITFLQDYYLTPGKYYWKLQIQSGYTAVLDAKVKLEYEGLKSAQPINYNGSELVNAAYGGGLRIKRISDFDNINAQPKITRYEYHTIDAEGKHISNGRRMARPMYSYFDDDWGSVNGGSNYTDYYRFEHLVRESDSNIPLNGSAAGSSVGYDAVTVYYGENGENGKTIYEFENIPDIIWDYSEDGFINGIACEVPRKPPVFSGFANASNGNIRTQTDFKNQSNSFIKVKEVSNTYDELIGNSTPLWYGIEKRKWNGAINLFSCPFRAYVYPTLVEGRKLLTSTTTTMFDQDDVAKRISQTTTYTYNNNTHLQLMSTKQLTSKGDEMITSTTYPLDYADADADPAIVQMKGAKFMHGKVITQNTSIKRKFATEESLLSSVINKYQASDVNNVGNSHISVKEVAALETPDIPLPEYSPVSDLYPDGFKPRLQFDKYDADGKIVQMHKTNDIVTSYIYGYNNEFPVAEIIGVNHDVALTAVNQSILNDLSTTEDDMRTELNKIRTGFPNAMVTTFTYKPLIGMTSQTDVNGRTTYYQYDSFNRLKLIKDKDGNILKTFQYKFQDQQ